MISTTSATGSILSSLMIWWPPVWAAFRSPVAAPMSATERVRAVPVMVAPRFGPFIRGRRAFLIIRWSAQTGENGVGWSGESARLSSQPEQLDVLDIETVARTPKDE